MYRRDRKFENPEQQKVRWTRPSRFLIQGSYKLFIGQNLWPRRLQMFVILNHNYADLFPQCQPRMTNNRMIHSGAHRQKCEFPFKVDIPKWANHPLINATAQPLGSMSRLERHYTFYNLWDRMKRAGSMQAGFPLVESWGWIIGFQSIL